jgi:hypothetical protein
MLALHRQTPAVLVILFLLAQSADKALSLRKLVALVARLRTGATPGTLVEVYDQGIVCLDLLEGLREGDPLTSDRDEEGTADTYLEEGPSGDAIRLAMWGGRRGER